MFGFCWASVGPCEYVGQPGYELLAADPISHHAFHVFQNAGNSGVLAGWPTTFDGGHHGRLTRDWVAGAAYAAAKQMREKAAAILEQVPGYADLSRREIIGMLQIVKQMDYVVSQCNWFLDVYSSELTYGKLDADIARKWITDCRADLASAMKILDAHAAPRLGSVWKWDSSFGGGGE